MNLDSAADRDLTIPVFVRRQMSLPVKPHQQLARGFALISAITAALAGLALLVTQPDKPLVAPVAMGYLVLAVVSALILRLPAVHMPKALAATNTAPSEHWATAKWMTASLPPPRKAMGVMPRRCRAPS